MANGWASITLELLEGNTCSPRTKRVNDSVRSLVETFLIHAHFTALLCCLSSSRIYSSNFLTCLQNKSTNKKRKMGAMKRSMSEGFSVSIKAKNAFGDDSRLLPSHFYCWSYLLAFEKSLTTCFWKSFENVLQKRAFGPILSIEKRFVRKQIAMVVCQPECVVWLLKTEQQRP